MDDFGVKYFHKQDVQHLLDTVQQKYTAKVDWTGKDFLGFSLDWNYDNGYVDLQMPKYVPKMMKKLNYTPSSQPQYSPHEYTTFQYSKIGDRQYAKPDDSSPVLNKTETKWVQSAIGSLLYYGRALDSSILPALNQLGTQQALPTENVKKKIHRLLDYTNTYRNPILRFYASDMILTIDSDAAYLVLPKARSRIAGYFRLLNQPNTNTFQDNGAVLIECKSLRNVVSSAAEAETNGVFHNAKIGVNLRHLLIAMGHPQPVTIIKTDNSTTNGFVNNNIQLKKSKSWDMQLHWLRDRENLSEFKVIWEQSVKNLADYFTKHHSTIHHRTMRSKYLRDTACHIYNRYLLDSPSDFTTVTTQLLNDVKLYLHNC